MAGGRTVVFLGGSDTLQPDPPNGKVYRPGDHVQLSDPQRASLMANGLRFGEVPDEPAPDPVPNPPPALEPAEVSAAVIETTAPTRRPPARAKEE